MKEVQMSFEEAFKIVAKYQRELLLTGVLTAKTPAEKAVLADALNLMESEIEDTQRRQIANQRWNDFAKHKKQKA